MSNKIPLCYHWSVLPVFSPVRTEWKDVLVTTGSQTAEFAFSSAHMSQWSWRSHQSKWSMHKDMKSRDLDLQRSEAACAWTTNTRTQKANLPTRNVSWLPEAPKTAGIFFPSAGCLKYLLLSQGWLRVSGWPECAFQMDVCHRMIDMPPAVASTNHTRPIVVQQPSDKQHDKHSHLWGHSSPSAPAGFTESALLPQ